MGWTCAGVVVALLAAGLLGSGAAAATEDGKAVFDQLCQGCHTIGGGASVGPDLQGLPDRADRDWVQRFILEPDKVIASGDPVAKKLVAQYGMEMPNLGVTDAQIGPLLAYLGFTATTPSATTPAETTPTTPTATTSAGDVSRGENLFQGHVRFAAGGPACLSCHAVAGVGALGGGQLGPDLTGAYVKYGGAQGLGSVLETIPFPTMRPIFSRNPLTASERADLVAFLATAPTRQRSAGDVGKLVGFAIIVVAVLVFLAMGIWKRRLNGVRQPLVNRARGK